MHGLGNLLQNISWEPGVVVFPLFLSFSPRRVPYEDRFVRKSSPPGITDLSTSFLGCLVTLPLFVIVPYLGQL